MTVNSRKSSTRRAQRYLKKKKAKIKYPSHCLQCLRR
jgi:hypothetical protein